MEEIMCEFQDNLVQRFAMMAERAHLCKNASLYLGGRVQAGIALSLVTEAEHEAGIPDERLVLERIDEMFRLAREEAVAQLAAAKN